MTIPLQLLAIHFVADFLLQSDWMAQNKSRRWDALAAHVAVYSACFFYYGAPFVAMTFLLHFVTDAMTSRITSRLWFFDMAMPVQWPSRRAPNSPAVPHYAVGGGNRHWFFVVIGADQLIHFLCLAWTLRVLG